MSKASCDSMCPREEFIQRENERLLHPLETVPGTEKDRRPRGDPERAVKRFVRSAAGLDLTDPRLLRPRPVLQKTIAYLIQQAVDERRRRFPFACHHDFIVDRMRAVVQDSIVQRLSPSDSIFIYEPILKYHIFSHYLMLEENASVFDATLHSRRTTEYLNRLLVCYDEEGASNGETDRGTIEAINLLYNLGERDPLLRYFHIDDKTDALKISFQISYYYMMNNYVKIFRLLVKLPPLLLCAIGIHFPTIRKRALQVMSVAYNSKHLTFPVDELKQILLYGNDSDAIEECSYYGLKISPDKQISFIKENFDQTLKTKIPKRSSFIDSKLKPYSKLF